MKKERISINLTLGILFTIVTGLMNFLINKLFGDTLGQETLGIFRLFTQLIAYMSLAELGLAAAAQSQLYRSIKEDDIEKTSNILYTLDYFYKRVALIVMCVGLLLNFALHCFVNNTDIYVFICWTMYVTSLSVSYLYAKNTVLLTADQKYGFVQLIRNLVKLSLNLLQIASLIYFESFVVFAGLTVFASFCEWLIIHRACCLQYDEKFSNGYEKDHVVISKTKQLFVHNIAGVLVFNTDYIVLARFVNLSTVAIYSTYLLVLRFLELICLTFVNVIRPRLGSFCVSKSTLEIEKIYRDYYTLVCALTISLVIFLNEIITDFVFVWMGKGYEMGDVTVAMILFNFYCFVIRRPLDIFKEVLGYFNDIHLPIMEGVMNLILSLILVQFWGLDGVIFATCITNFVFIFIMKPYVVYKRVFNVDFIAYVRVCVSATASVILSILFFQLLSDDFNLTFVGILELGVKSLFIPLAIFSLSKSFRNNIRELMGCFFKMRLKNEI